MASNGPMILCDSLVKIYKVQTWRSLRCRVSTW